MGGKTVTYAYDSAQAGASRASRTAQRTEFLYGDVNRPFLVTGSRAGGQLTTYYYGVDDRLIALERGGRRYYVGADQVGTPRVVTDAVGRRRQDARLRQLRRARSRDRRPGRSSSRSASPAGSRIRSPGSCASACATTSRAPGAGRRATRSCTTAASTSTPTSGSDPVAKRDPSGLDEEVGGDGGGDGGATGDFGSEGTGSEGSGGGMLEAIKEFFTREDTGMAIEALAEMEEMDGDSEIVKGASRLKKGMDAIELAEDVAESVVIIQEAEATENLGEEGLGWLRVCAKAIGKIVPVDIFGTGVVDPLLDKAVPHYRDQNRKGSINYQVQQALERNGTP